MKFLKKLLDKDPIEFNLRFTMTRGNERANYSKKYYFKKEEDFRILFDKMSGMIDSLDKKEERENEMESSNTSTDNVDNVVAK